jgi:murein DD-endopeptidase MepM/ murein hydrolase activator NlpD
MAEVSYMKLILMAVTLMASSVLMTAATFAPIAPQPAGPAEAIPASLQWPIDGKFLQGFGYGHRGIDIGDPYGTPVGVSADGWVREVTWERGYGKYVVVDHGNGIETLYAHLADTGVEPGQPLAAGDTLGWVGATGYATTTHLHFEVHVDGWAQNPLGYLP